MAKGLAVGLNKGHVVNKTEKSSRNKKPTCKYYYFLCYFLIFPYNNIIKI